MTTYAVYGDTFYNSKTLKEQAKQYLTVLPAEVTLLISQGNSGCTIASAMLIQTENKLDHYPIRKPGETAHKFGLRPKHRRAKVAIVDDLISSGQTIERLLTFCTKNNLEVQVIIVSRLWPEYAYREKPTPKLEKIRAEGKLIALYNRALEQQKRRKVGKCLDHTIP